MRFPISDAKLFITLLRFAMLLDGSFTVDFLLIVYCEL